MNLTGTATSACYRQTFGKIRSVDCSLDNFQSLAREIDGSTADEVSFVPSGFELLSYNKRKNKPLSLQFDSFYGICESLRLRSSVRSELIFQSKTDAEGLTTVLKIIGSVIEKSQRKHGIIPSTRAVECAIVPGACFAMLRRNNANHGNVICSE